jgi:hypothetical protein
MITYWRLVHCHWVKVTTARAIWAGLRHVAGLSLACASAGSAPLPAYPYLPFQAPQVEAPAPEAIWYPYPGASSFEAIAGTAPIEVGGMQVGARSPLVRTVPEPTSLALLAPAAALAWLVRRRSIKRFSPTEGDG